MLKINCIECNERLIDYMRKLHQNEEFQRSMLISSGVFDKSGKEANKIVQSDETVLLNWNNEGSTAETIIVKPCSSHKGFYEIMVIVAKDFDFVGAKEFDESNCTVIKLPCECRVF